MAKNEAFWNASFDQFLLTLQSPKTILLTFPPRQHNFKNSRQNEKADRLYIEIFLDPQY